jgi:hypothetical protein
MNEHLGASGLLRDARDRGGNFLLSFRRPDGGFGPPERGLADYYKVISAYQVCGATNAASQLCDWVRRHGMTPQGDFGPRILETMEYYYPYYNAWVVTGGHRLGQFDISQRGMDFLMNFWDADSGGFYCSATERNASTKQDLWVVSGCGLAALSTGRLQVALGVGEWMQRMMNAQPDYPRKLYGVFSRSEGLIVDFESSDIRYVVSCDPARDEFFFSPGIASGFLARLYMATGQPRWLDLAQQFLLIAEHANDYFFQSVRAGKVGWAASLLYTLTGKDIYREMALRVGQYLIWTQTADGSWCFPSMCSNDVSAEMVVWLDEIYQACGGGADSVTVASASVSRTV